MDCEKFEPLLLDELYEELDELTSAAVKRHVSGCARCAAILNGLKSTRRAVTFPIVDVPDGLEERILAATREAQKVVPIRSRASRAVSWAGSWAMRPQTAMAAVFLLMIGSSAFLLRSKRDSAQEASVSVTVIGEPASTVAAADHDSLDDKAAAAAHGATAPMATASPTAFASGYAMNTAPPAAPILADPARDPASAGPMDRLTARAARDKDSNDDSALGSTLSRGVAKEERAQGEKKAAMPLNAAAPAGAPYADEGAAPPPPSQAASKAAVDPQDGFSAGMAAYRTRNFAEATRLLDGAAQSGDQNAALWAAKSVREYSGCASALPRFEAVAQKAAGSWHGSEATLEAANCQVAIGQLDVARERLVRLTSVPSHEARARTALAELNQVASRRESERSRGAGTSGGGGVASPKRPAAAAPAPAKPAATTDVMH